jgi:import receptor subunit TOM20
LFYLAYNLSWLTRQQEEPLVAALDFAAHRSGSFCAYCFKRIKDGTLALIEPDVLRGAFCSQQCNLRAKLQSDNFLFGEGRALPLGLDEEPSDEAKTDRKEAQEQFIDIWKNSGKASVMLAARLSALQVNAEIVKAVPQADTLKIEFPKLCFVDDYSVSDHTERLRYVDIDVPKSESRSLQHVLAMTMPTLSASYTDERYSVMRGKIAYNAIAINSDEDKESDVSGMTLVL